MGGISVVPRDRKTTFDPPPYLKALKPLLSFLVPKIPVYGEALSPLVDVINLILEKMDEAEGMRGEIIKLVDAKIDQAHTKFLKNTFGGIRNLRDDLMPQDLAEMWFSIQKECSCSFEHFMSGGPETLPLLHQFAITHLAAFAFFSENKRSKIYDRRYSRASFKISDLKAWKKREEFYRKRYVMKAQQLAVQLMVSHLEKLSTVQCLWIKVGTKGPRVDHKYLWEEADGEKLYVYGMNGWSKYGYKETSDFLKEVCQQVEDAFYQEAKILFNGIKDTLETFASFDDEAIVSGIIEAEKCLPVRRNFVSSGWERLGAGFAGVATESDRRVNCYNVGLPFRNAVIKVVLSESNLFSPWRNTEKVSMLEVWKRASRKKKR